MYHEDEYAIALKVPFNALFKKQKGKKPRCSCKLKIKEKKIKDFKFCPKCGKQWKKKRPINRITRKPVEKTFFNNLFQPYFEEEEAEDFVVGCLNDTFFIVFQFENSNPENFHFTRLDMGKMIYFKELMEKYGFWKDENFGSFFLEDLNDYSLNT